MPNWRIHFALVAVLLVLLPVHATARPPKKENFFSKFFDSVIPWRRSVPDETTPPPTTTNSAEIESILNAIDTPNAVLRTDGTDIPNVKVSNGRLTMNETELFVIDNDGNSSVLIIDGNAANGGANSSEEAPNSESSTRHPTFHRRLTANRVCDKLSVADKYKKLEKLNAKNPMFMASSLEEGKYGFKPLVPRNDSRQEKEIDRLSDAVGAAQRAFMGVDMDLDEDDDEYCDEFCQEVSDTIESIEKGKAPMMSPANLMYNVPFHDTSAEHLPTEPPLCTLDNFRPLDKQKCNLRGTATEFEGLDKLCTACQGIYTLADNCFPNLINGIKCSGDEDESDCIFVRTQSMGQCRGKTIPLTILRNIGTSECENWVKEIINVPIACECYLSETASGISAAPRPSR